MNRAPSTSRRALRAALTAVALTTAVTFAAANFVLVDVRLLTIGFTTRLAWAVLAPVALAFGAGVLWARSSDAARSPGDALARRADGVAPRGSSMTDACSDGDIRRRGRPHRRA